MIEGYGTRLNLHALGCGLQAVVRVRTTHEHVARYVQLFQSLPEVLNVLRVTGEDCFIVYCAFAVPQDLERVVDTLARCSSVTTSLALSSPVAKPPRGTAA